MSRALLSFFVLLSILTLYCIVLLYFPKSSVNFVLTEGEADVEIDLGLIEDFKGMNYTWRVYNADTGELLAEWNGSIYP